jgi:uncharacterized membrane protein YgcG
VGRPNKGVRRLVRSTQGEGQEDPKRGKSFTPLNAARGPRAAHPVAALGRPIFCVFLAFFVCFSFLFVSVFSSFMFPFSAIIYIIIFLI